MIRRTAVSLALLCGCFAFAPAMPTAQACPMCKLANEEGSDPLAAATANARPRAYMFSILFMLGMPATLLTAFGVSFYRLYKSQQSTDASAEIPAEAVPSGPIPEPA